MANELHSKIKNLAKESGITLREISERSEIPYNTLYSAIRRNQKISTDMAIKLAKALNVNVSDITGEQSDIDAFKLRIAELEKENHELKITIKTFSKLVRAGD